VLNNYCSISIVFFTFALSLIDHGDNNNYYGHDLMNRRDQKNLVLTLLHRFLYSTAV